MKAVLAGYNLDISVINEAARAGVPRERLTPEVLSAAYARISRDPRPVHELRRDALEEVEKARNSNKNIIFKMGHHSVAEHAVFNFDILGISRLAIEELEQFRLCSYTEKSQRYITLDNDFVIPAELQGTPLETELLTLVSAQSKLYDQFNAVLSQRLKERHPQMTKKRSGRRLLESWAKEDARYVTILATTGQLGLTANARNLELMIRRLAAAPLAELRELGRMLFDAGSAVAPSILLFTEASSFDTQAKRDLAVIAEDLLSDRDPPSEDEIPQARLIGHTQKPDQVVAAALLHNVTNAPFAKCKRTVAQMSAEELRALFQTALKHMEFFDAPPREFEHVILTFELTVSSSCFAQLKRHRMATQSVQEYDPALGLTIPPALLEAGLEEPFRHHAAQAEELFDRIREQAPAAACYALTNAHRRRVVLTLNLRELYHVIRLREDFHAQWDIRALARNMRTAAEEVMPLGTMLLSGKDSYPERYSQVYGRAPKIDPADL